MADVHWRPASPNDLALIADWIETAWALERWAGAGLSWPTDAPTLWQQLDANNHPSFCLDLCGQPIAFGQLFRKGERHLHLARIIVSPNHRRHGLGEKLCLQLIAEARRRRAERVTLNVFADNTAAIHLYRRLGFIDHGAVDTRGIQPMQLRQFATDVDNTDH